ncbi:MAG: glycosyltransferase family 4 protein [Gemmatimonadales bacterium]
MTRSPLVFVIESGTDVRLVDGLAGHFEVTVLARAIPGGRAVNWPPVGGAVVVEGPASRIGFARWAMQQVTARRPDRVLAQGYGLSALAVLRTRPDASLLVCSPVERYYDTRRAAGLPHMPWRAWERAAIAIVARANARWCSHYVVLSEHLAEVVASYKTRAAIDVIPVYGVDTARFVPLPRVERRALRAHLRLPDHPIIFFSSRIAPEKDVATLLGACARLVADGRAFTLLHMSGGWQAFQDAARAAGLGAHVIAREAVHPARDLPSWYQASDLCVQASRAEGLGFSVLEALACEVPVVATAVGGLTETIRDGDTGWSYDVGDAAGLAVAMAEALDDPAEAARRAHAGRLMVERRYAARAVFQQLAAALTERR